jgi:hypothetical protein
MKHRNLLGERKETTRGLLILVARLTARNHNRFFSLCHYLARVKQLWENEPCYLARNEMAGLKGKSGPPGNMNAFKHGLAAIQKRREETFTQNRIEWRSEQRTSTPLLGSQIDHVSSETIN